MPFYPASRRPIGVFDSGVGGLTIVSELRRRMPNESLIYFGDIARLPYGIKSKEQIQRFSLENTHFLLKKGVKAVVIACNSSSSAAYSLIRRNFRVPVLDVITPAVEEALRMTRNGRIGVIGTQATVDSRAYTRSLLRRKPSLKIFSLACPLFVSLVEAGWMSGKITADIIRHYLAPMKRRGVDTLILGCTHYPLLKREIASVMGRRVELIDSAGPCVESLSALLGDKGLLNRSGARGPLKIFVSDLPRNFVKVGERFLREPLREVKVVR